MGQDVFISYKSEEFQEADWVRQKLESGGISCWMAPNSITGGALLNITSLAVALIVGIVTNLIVNNGKLSSGEDGLSSAASEMGKVDPETTEIPSRKSKKK